MLNNALSVAEFNAPLVPGIRSVEYPSMNKDGVPFGVLTGILAIKAHQCGFEGNKNLLEADEYKHYLDDLGQKWQVMDLYFKPYTCCRWGHPAIDACLAVIIDAIKKAQDGNGYIIRVVEQEQRRGNIEINWAFGFEKVIECNMIEEDKAEIQSKIDALKNALNGEDINLIKNEKEALTQAFYKISEKLYQQAQAAGAQPGGFNPEDFAGAQGGYADPGAGDGYADAGYTDANFTDAN